MKLIREEIESVKFISRKAAFVGLIVTTGSSLSELNRIGSILRD